MRFYARIFFDFIHIQTLYKCLEYAPVIKLQRREGLRKIGRVLYWALKDANLCKWCTGIGSIKNSPVFGELFSEFWRFGEHLISGVRTPAQFCAILVFYLRTGRDSNPRPLPWQGSILTNWTTDPTTFQKSSKFSLFFRECKDRFLIFSFQNFY